MDVIHSIDEMQRRSLALRDAGRRLAFVPTMGALHEGHLTLIDAAKKRGDCVVLSIFVNPTQFGPSEDFARYPRDLKKDGALAESRGVNMLFAPDAAEMYAPGAQTFVEVTELTRGLCSASRPGHFRGVATVVAKLFLMVLPHVALFGEKDYQQLQVIRRMVLDLKFPIEIVGVPTVRESDGLAMSSRNAYLSAEARREAAQLYSSLRKAETLVQSGERDAGKIRAAVEAVLRETPAIHIEYVAIVDADTLESLTQIDRPARAMLAVQLHGTRLIDNLALAL